MTIEPSGAPTAPIELSAPASAVTSRVPAPRVELDDGFVRRLGDACHEVLVTDEALVESSRDWWPLATIWALEGQVAARAGVVARAATAEEVASVLAICDEARVPVTPSAGRSGVCGASVPIHGGVVLDLTPMSGIVGVDEHALVLDVRAGTFGSWLEDQLRARFDATLGHWPQSIDLSTVGGWLACRGAGQLSTRYGKIEDMVVGLDVVLADGRRITTGGSPRAAVGPDLNQVFVGSEGTLGVITGARLRLHRAPAVTRTGAWSFSSFAAGMDACRRVLHRGATPAALRLYDAIEADRSYATGDRHLLLVLDEGDAELVDATMRVVKEECAAESPADDQLVEQWLGHRNDVSALERTIRRGLVVDTMEIAASWTRCQQIYERVCAAIGGTEHTLVCSAHLSHSYPDGACLYFTFAGNPPEDAKDAYYVAAWDVGTRAVLEAGGALSHHHGVGLNRARFVRDALGPAFDVLVALKQALDPRGILNPGKLGLPDPFGNPSFP